MLSSSPVFDVLALASALATMVPAEQADLSASPGGLAGLGEWAPTAQSSKNVSLFSRCSMSAIVLVDGTEWLSLVFEELVGVV